METVSEQDQIISDTPLIEESLHIEPEAIVETPFAPVGWLTQTGVAKLLGRSDNAVHNAVQSYKESMPDCFQIFKATANSDHRERLFFSPEIVEILSNELGSKVDAPDGWVAAAQLPTLLNRDRTTLDRMAAKYADTNPEWFGVFATSKAYGKKALHYSPELIIVIKAEMLPSAPDGWFTVGALAKAVGKDWRSVKKKVAEYKYSQPEQFQNFSAKGVVSTEYISPDIANEIINHYGTRYPTPPDGWMTRNQLSQILPRTRPTISKALDQYRQSNPEWFQSCRLNKAGSKVTEYFAPELVELIGSELSITEPAPDGWLTISALYKELGVSANFVRRTANQLRDDHPEWFSNYKEAKLGHTAEHMSPELVAAIKGIFAEQASIPAGWVTQTQLADELDISLSTLGDRVNEFRETYPECIKSYWVNSDTEKKNGFTTFLHPEIAQHIRDRYSSFSVFAPDDWVSFKSLRKTLGVSDSLLREFINGLVLEYPDWAGTFKGEKTSPKPSLFVHPQLAELANNYFAKNENVPPGWVTRNSLRKELHVAGETLQEIATKYLELNPEWQKLYKPARGKVALHYSPELVELLKTELLPLVVERDIREKAEREKADLEEKVTEFVSNLSKGESFESYEFQALLQMFGSERAVDILFQYRPEYRKVSLPFAKRVIGDYLGEFLVVRGDLQIDKLEIGVQYLSDPNLREGLREVIKSDCLRAYNDQRRSGLIGDDLSTLQSYINDLRKKTVEFNTSELAEILDEVEEYYNALFDVIQIPDNVVEELEAGRLFPDINQRINILELMGKQKMLIADEMGVGKSASAILAKESLGVKQALVVVPSNVIEVWQKYLSDYRNGDGSAKGYFKEGQSPNVLIISNDLDSLKDLDPSEYDYVLVSQERLNDNYMAFLEQLDYDMLIVDEAHKLKNITSGKRADKLVKLAEKVEGDDKYLALLSGTPVPNHVGDVAMVLKLLYPEKFQNVANKDLTRQILDGDVLDLRSLLVPRMQMKSLAESIEMPTLHEELHAIQMTEEERNAYEVLLEEDELTASQKLQILRQFAMNPQIFEITPGFQSSKLKAVGESLRTTFADKNKVVMFVNGYIDGVIRGENTIFDGLELPEDVETYVIDGKVTMKRRLEIQQLLQQQSDRKMLLAVSGQTADVGVDFSGAEELYFYNEPWTEYDKHQQQGRVYRPGLRHDLVSHTFYVEGSVEEGIHKYIGYKYTAVEKLLRGIPLSELERELLREDEKQVDQNLEVNPTLAEHYLSQWHRMLKIYSYVKGIGEKDFISFLGKYGQEYAECYTDLGSRSYQANVGRLAGTTIDTLAKSKKQDPQFVRILDVASGPEMLKSHISEEYQHQVVSVDINPHHFEQVDEKRRVGSFLDLPVADSTVDYANLSLALHYTKLSLRQGVYEPVKVFQELNRVLVNEGVAVINLMHNNDLKDPNLFAQAIEKVGFKVVEGLSGEVSSANNFKSRMLVLQKVGSCTQDTTTLVRQLGTPLLHGFKLAKTDVKIKDSRKIVTTFLLDGAKRINARLNSTDEIVLNEEQATLAAMKSLRRKYGSVQNIPKEMIYQSGLARAFTGKTYVLFKSLETGNGAVITR